MLHHEGGQGLQELRKEIQDAKSKLRQCLYCGDTEPCVQRGPDIRGQDTFHSAHERLEQMGGTAVRNCTVV